MWPCGWFLLQLALPMEMCVCLQTVCVSAESVKSEMVARSMAGMNQKSIVDVKRPAVACRAVQS